MCWISIWKGRNISLCQWAVVLKMHTPLLKICHKPFTQRVLVLCGLPHWILPHETCTWRECDCQIELLNVPIYLKITLPLWKTLGYNKNSPLWFCCLFQSLINKTISLPYCSSLCLVTKSPCPSEVSLLSVESRTKMQKEQKREVKEKTNKQNKKQIKTFVSYENVNQKCWFVG